MCHAHVAKRFSYIRSPGLHTLFLRWTGGDTRGGGDSLYAVIRKADTDEIMPGVDTMKPAKIPIDQTPGQFTGCCYDHHTHACPCYTPGMNPDVTCANRTLSSWIPVSQTSRWHPTCDSVAGEMETVTAPKWYLFSGQEAAITDAGTSMNFDNEPWDATCEAAGTGTADSGQDFARWSLPAGLYHLVIYPREDGTAVDGFYLTAPGTDPPDGATRLAAGASTTTCPNGPMTTRVATSAADLQHRGGDANGWGRHRGKDSGGDPHAQAGLEECGRCLVPLDPQAGEVCPTPEVLQTMKTCDGELAIGELCEADGECGTNVRINNCDNPLPDPAVTGGGDGDGGGKGLGSSPRRFNRNNDVYKRVKCPAESNLGMIALIFFLVVLLALVAYGYVTCSRKQHGVIVAPWKLIKVAARAKTSTVAAPTVSTYTGPGPLAAAGTAPGISADATTYNRA